MPVQVSFFQYIRNADKAYQPLCEYTQPAINQKAYQDFVAEPRSPVREQLMNGLGKRPGGFDKHGSFSICAHEFPFFLLFPRASIKGCITCLFDRFHALSLAIAYPLNSVSSALHFSGTKWLARTIYRRWAHPISTNSHLMGFLQQTDRHSEGSKCSIYMRTFIFVAVGLLNLAFQYLKLANCLSGNKWL